MADLPSVPAPPKPEVQRFDAQGRPTVAQVTYEARLHAFLVALRAAVIGAA